MVNIDGNPVDFDVVVALMDDDLREALHMQLAPCDEQSFCDAYLDAHRNKFNEEFKIN